MLDCEIFYYVLRCIEISDTPGDYQSDVPWGMTALSTAYAEATHLLQFVLLIDTAGMNSLDICQCWEKRAKQASSCQQVVLLPKRAGAMQDLHNLVEVRPDPFFSRTWNKFRGFQLHSC
jgi:hypothetical protein